MSEIDVAHDFVMALRLSADVAKTTEGRADETNRQTVRDVLYICLYLSYIRILTHRSTCSTLILCLSVVSSKTYVF